MVPAIILLKGLSELKLVKAVKPYLLSGQSLNYLGKFFLAGEDQLLHFLLCI
jgi:hypothetical protein